MSAYTIEMWCMSWGCGERLEKVFNPFMRERRLTCPRCRTVYAVISEPDAEYPLVQVVSRP